MLRNSLVFVFSCLLAGTSITAFAARDGGPSGGLSGSHMSNSGRVNTNGPLSADRDKGLQRAEDRMSASGASHEKAKQKEGKRKGKP